MLDFWKFRNQNSPIHFIQDETFIAPVKSAACRRTRWQTLKLYSFANFLFSRKSHELGAIYSGVQQWTTFQCPDSFQYRSRNSSDTKKWTEVHNVSHHCSLIQVWRSSWARAMQQNISSASHTVTYKWKRSTAAAKCLFILAILYSLMLQDMFFGRKRRCMPQFDGIP